ncbi:MAG: sensor histidine kinase [Bacillota bacterium]
MKQLFSRKVSIFAAIVILFIFGQLAGITAIKAFFIEDKIKDLMPQLQYIADRIGEGNFKVSGKERFIIKAYDVHGKELDIFDDDSNLDFIFSDEGIKESLSKYIPRIIAGNNVADLQYIGKLPSRSIVIGVPLVKDSHLTGVVFLLKPASDYQAAINGFSLVFFITLFVGTIFIAIFLWLYVKETKILEQTRKNYIANISHELKSPISSIKALTETLSDGMVQDEERKDRYYEIILKESHRLEKLITDMLELSKLQSAKTVFSKEVIDARKLMKTVHDKYSILANDIGIGLEMTENTKALPALYSSEHRILQLLNILIDNAMKFEGENGKVVIDSECYAREVTIIVKDNGIGIEKNSLPYVFDRFYKEDKAHNTGGSGLGLSIAREIIQGLNEKIEVTSEYGKGTEFRFTIKRA